MMQQIMLCFVVIWLISAVIGIVNPVMYFQKFISFGKVLGIKPDKMAVGAKLVCRVLNGGIFILCIFILFCLLTGQVQF